MNFRSFLRDLNSMTAVTELSQYLERFEVKKNPLQNTAEYHGKVRTVIDLHDGKLELFHSDRLSAFDCYIADVPFKGMILAHIAAWWFEKLNFLPQHFLSQKDDRTLVCLKLTPIKIEVVVRGYLAGSLLRGYEKGNRIISALVLPDGLKPFQKLPQPIITPTTKAAAFAHDEETSAAELVKNSTCTEGEWAKISEYALQVFQFGSDVLCEKGWILVDTKYEFGKDKDGKIFLIDEVHTPDSSRFWRQNSYFERLESNLEPEMLDKENIRQFLIKKGFTGVGQPPDVPFSEIKKLLKTYLEIYLSLTS